MFPYAKWMNHLLSPSCHFHARMFKAYAVGSIMMCKEVSGCCIPWYIQSIRLMSVIIHLSCACCLCISLRTLTPQIQNKIVFWPYMWLSSSLNNNQISTLPSGVFATQRALTTLWVKMRCWAMFLSCTLMLATFVCWYSALTLLVHGQAMSGQPDLCATCRRVCKPHVPDLIVSWDVLLILVLAAERLCGHYDVAQLYSPAAAESWMCDIIIRGYTSQDNIILQRVNTYHTQLCCACLYCHIDDVRVYTHILSYVCVYLHKHVYVFIKSCLWIQICT